MDDIQDILAGDEKLSGAIDLTTLLLKDPVMFCEFGSVLMRQRIKGHIRFLALHDDVMNHMYHPAALLLLLHKSILLHL